MSRAPRTAVVFTHSMPGETESAIAAAGRAAAEAG